MAMLDVSCPSCGAKLKADEKMAGKKAKCKKCGTGFRIPGQKVGESLAEGQMLSTLGTPVPPLPGDDADVAMAMPMDDDIPMAAPLAPPPPAAKPADVAALPSADPFDFNKPAAPVAKAAPAAPAAPVPPPPPPAAPAKSAFGGAKAAPAPPPAAPAPKPVAPPPPPPAPVAKAAPPAAPAKPAAPPPPEAEPVAEATEIEDEDDSPFSFGGGGAPAAKKGAKDDSSKKEKGAKPKAEDPAPAPKKKAKPAKSADATEADAPAPDPNNPFTLGALLDAPAEPKKKRGDDEPKEKRAKKDGEDDTADNKPGYRPPEERGGKGMAFLITLVVGGLALALGGAAVVRFVKDKRADAELIAEAKRKAEEEAKKKNEDPFANTPPNPGGPGPEPKDKKDPDPKPKDKGGDPKGKDKVEPKPKDVNPLSGKPMIGVPKLKAVTVAPVGDKLKLTDGQKDRVELATPFAAVRRAFPRAKAGEDLHVLIQTSPGAGGTGEQLALDTYTASGARDAAARIELAGDSVPQPIADLIVSPNGTFFVAGILGNLHVWDVRAKRKLADGLDPYKDKPEHRKAGLAAAFFAPGGKQVVTVSTAGAVLLVDLASGKAVSEFVPEHGTAGRVALGTSVAKADGNGSIAVAVAGVVYQVKAAPGLDVVRKLDLGGDVGRSMGIAVSGTPGRIFYAFETNDNGKKDKAVAVLPLDDKGKGPQFFAFPTGAAGTDGKGAVFAGGALAGAITEKGAVWFDDEEGKVVPLMATVPVANAQFYGTDLHFWYVIPDPKAPAKSAFVAVSTDLNKREELKTNFPTKPLAALRIDAEGASH